MYQGNTSWDFLGVSRRVLVCSAVAVIICVAALLVRGLNLGIEFEGGAAKGAALVLGSEKMIPGFESGILNLGEGSIARIAIPPEMGYGAIGVKGLIPPNETIYFEVKIIKVEAD